MASKLVNGKRVIVGSKADPLSKRYESKPVQSPYYQSQTPTTPVTTVSTDRGRNIVNRYKTDQAVDETQLAGNTATNQKLEADRMKNEPKKGEGYSFDEAKTLGLDLNNADYDSNTNTFIPKSDTVIDPDRQKTLEIDKQYDDDIKEIDKVFKTQQDYYEAANNAVYNSINGIYKQLADEQRKANKQAYDAFQNFGIREGTQRYGGEIQQGILNAEERAGLQRLQDIAFKQATALADAKQAATEKSWQIFASKRKEIADLKSERQTQLKEIREKAEKRLEETRKATIKASRDNSIASLVEQGVTDPKKVLNFLNYDDEGKQIGDFTIKEVGDALNVLVPKPKALKTADKLTRLEAVNQGLPLSLVGLSENDINTDFQSNDPPNWFEQKAEAEARQQLLPGILQQLWDSYKAAYGKGDTMRVEVNRDEADAGGDEFEINQADFE